MPEMWTKVSSSLNVRSVENFYFPVLNGVQMKIWQCYDNLPQQTWTPVMTSGPIALSVDDVCLDLTNGVDADRTILQVWQCAAGNRNQIWNVELYPSLKSYIS